MKIKTDDVGKCKYLSSGKIYKVKYYDGNGGIIVDDTGKAIYISFYEEGSAHISYNKWEIIKENSNEK